MKHNRLLFTVAPLALMLPAVAYAAPVPANAKAPSAAETPVAEASLDKAADKEVFSTGVAKGRDRLDSATSTSALRADDIQKLGARPLAEILRNIPGIRTEASIGYLEGLIGALESHEAKAACAAFAQKVAIGDFYRALADCRTLITYETVAFARAECDAA